MDPKHSGLPSWLLWKMFVFLTLLLWTNFNDSIDTYFSIAPAVSQIGICLSPWNWMEETKWFANILWRTVGIIPPSRITDLYTHFKSRQSAINDSDPVPVCISNDGFDISSKCLVRKVVWWYSCNLLAIYITFIALKKGWKRFISFNTVNIGSVD